MKPLRAFSLILFMATIVFPQPQPTVLPHAAQFMSGANPEMDRLAKALAGDWSTVERMERGQFFPSGGSRHGVVHARVASGGFTLVYEVHSDGSAGKLDGFHIIWWDKKRQLYYFFACFNNPDDPCKMRGTARWEGNSFVNDYEFIVNGKNTRWRDIFTFTPNSHTLVAAVDSGMGAMEKVITTTANRATLSVP